MIDLVPKTRSEMQAMIDGMSDQDRAQVSPEWLARFHASAEVDPWFHGFTAVLRANGEAVGMGGFKGPPANGTVEIAYAVDEAHRRKGYATLIAAGLADYAFRHDEVRLILAHTLPTGVASQRVLARCGFEHVGEFNDPEDGLVWRFSRARNGSHTA